MLLRCEYYPDCLLLKAISLLFVEVKVDTLELLEPPVLGRPECQLFTAMVP